MKDNREYYGQQCKDPKINEAFRNLHEHLVNEVIGFCKAWNISIDEFHLSADDVEASIKFGSWQACTDSCLQFDKFTQEYKDCVSMKDEESIKKITNKKEWARIKSEQEPFLFSM